VAWKQFGCGECRQYRNSRSTLLCKRRPHPAAHAAEFTVCDASSGRRLRRHFNADLFLQPLARQRQRDDVAQLQ
jgi:hypothetical protein